MSRDEDEVTPVQTPPMPGTQRPSLGRIVLYVDNGGLISPAIIVGFTEVALEVNLQVFFDVTGGVAYREAAVYDAAGDESHSWHWPPRV